MGKRFWALLLSVLMVAALLPAAALADGGPDDTNFESGRSISFLAPTSNQHYGELVDYKADDTFDGWETEFNDGETHYSEKTITLDDGSTAPYCAYAYTTDGGYLVLTKTYHKAVPDEDIRTEGQLVFDEEKGQMAVRMPYQGQGNAVLGQRFLAYNTSPDGSGDWYRCGQYVPSDVATLYAQFISPLSLIGYISNPTQSASAAIQLNGSEEYSGENPFIVLIDGQGSASDELYYTAKLSLTGPIARLIWSRMDELNIDADKTFIELQVDFAEGLSLLDGNGELTFQYKGGFVPYVDGAFVEPDEGSEYIYTLTVDEDDFDENNSLTLRFGLCHDCNDSPTLTLEQFSNMSLSVEGQPGARADISGLIGSVTDEQPLQVVTGGTVKVSATLSTSDSPSTGEVEIESAYAELYRLQSDSLSLRPADITIYMGGDEGASGVVSGDGSIVASNSLPEPGFTVALPAGLDAVDIADLTLFEAGTDRSWKLESYDGASTEVFRLVPQGAEQEPASVLFTNAGGTTVTGDEFDVGAAVNQQLTMSLYREDGSGAIAVEIDGRFYPIDSSGTGTLTVRGTTEQALYSGVQDAGDGFTAESGSPAVAAPAGTTYTINESDVGADAEGVALLFDAIIDTTGENRTGLLTARAEEELGSTSRQRSYEFRYLDLVDTHNGNAWVKASEPVTVYWPLPEGTDASTEFTLLHFKDLHREMDSADIAGDIADCDIEEIELVNDGSHISFSIPQSGFSPFALVWEVERDTPVRPPVVPTRPTEPEEPGETELPEDEVPAMLNGDDHYAYIVGYDDGTVRPGGEITRAEVSTIIFRLLKPEVRDGNLTSVNTFTDVPEDAWYCSAVSTLVKLGIITGRSETVFDPDAPITRAEFAALFARFAGDSDVSGRSFTDVRGHWAEDEISLAAALGWITGYGDGSFRPNSSITRAEAMTIINRVLNREPEDEDDLLSGMRTWTDNAPGTWYYLAVQEATNSHEYGRPNAPYESWTGLTADPDWTRYQ